jgi:hypothetical protein
MLSIGKSRFFQLLQAYRKNPEEFSIDYKRSNPTRSIDPTVKASIIKELSIAKKAIQNKKIPLYKYNYSYVQKYLDKKYGQTVALNTIINHTKDNNL